jgi:hypothetical protein
MIFVSKQKGGERVGKIESGSARANVPMRERTACQSPIVAPCESAIKEIIHECIRSRVKTYSASERRVKAMTREKTKRYNLVLPQPLFDELQRIADERQSTVLEVLKQFIRLGLLVSKAERSSDTAVVIREGDRERELMLI